MAGTAKGLSHAFVCTSQHVRAGSHGTSYDDGLAGQLVIHRNQWVVRRKGSGGAFSVHQQLLALAIYEMLFHFGNVVGDIVNYVHIQIFRRLIEDLGESLACQESHRRTVHPGVVGSCGHALQIVLALVRLYSGTRQLTVIGADVVPRHRPLHVHQGIGGNLMSQSTAARMDHDTYLSLLVNAHLLGDKLVVDFINHLDLGVVVPCAEGAQLGQPTLLCSAGNLPGIGVQHAAILLAVFLVLGPSVAFSK
mmetsp:Transcript_12815/g.30458  ORF Transcript_12815/g.30458 Transcript_12815/m.30458 type:complete len:250 (-) Transcript_12815:629-1378(-)